MMRKLVAGLAAASALFVGVPAFAANTVSPCPIGQVLRKIGTVTSDDGTGTAGTRIVSTAGWDVREIVITCKGTACVATLYDGTVFATDAVNANVTFEPVAAASVGSIFDLSATPIRFKNGILAHTDGNVRSVLCFACQSP